MTLVPPVGTVWYQSIEEIFAEWDSVDGGRPGNWSDVLAEKEDDGVEWYMDFLREEGFNRPLTCQVSADSDAVFTFGNGHHRLLAAFKLGWTHVPVVLCERWHHLAESYDWDTLEDDAQIYADCHEKFVKATEVFKAKNLVAA